MGDIMHEIDEKLKLLPERSGVYIMKDSSGEVIYVGKAKVLKNRVRQYFRSHNHAPKVAKMIENIADFEYIITDSEKEALILENNLIKENQPKYNILLKDDKTYPFIKVTVQEDFPRVVITRRVIRDGARYFGPYCSNFSLKELLTLINEVFSVRVCKKNITENKLEKRPCLYHQLGKCSAPCCGNISKEEYRKNIDNVISFLNGKYDKAISIINEKMKNAANELDFETAAKWRDSIQAVSLLEDNQKIVSATGNDSDAICVYSDNDVACVEIFFVRTGKIVGKEHYFLSHTDDTDLSVILSQFIRQYYDDSSFIPHELLLQYDIEDADTIREWLKEKSGHSIKFTIPKIGDKYKLMAMIAANAKKEHKERELKIMRDISFKNNALSSLQRITNLANPPMLIEAYDISSLSGNHKVGAMVTFFNGKPLREKYRNFKIKYVMGQDDYACMREVLSRRIEHGFNDKNSDGEKQDFYPFPDLILVDGGHAHVNTALKVLSEFGVDIPVFGIAKDDRHKTTALVTSSEELSISKSDEAFMLLTQIQDEMHRRAISHHKSLRDNSLLKTELLKIKGVGDKKAKILLRRFKSVKKIKDATLEELCSVAGIDKITAENVYGYFNGI